MAKRRNVVVLSDDDEDPPAPSRKPPLLPDRGPVYASKRTHPGSRKQSEKCRLEDIGADECKYQQPNTQLWVDKYRPKSLSDLAVHSKKIAEVREWLEAKLHCVDKLHAGSCVLVLAGPTGVGKTTVVRVLVDLLEAELCEWETPVPTLWKDYLHLVNTGVPYISKLKEFEEFLESVKKYPLLPLLPTLPQGIDKPLVRGPRSCGKPKVLLLDDLPAVHGRESASQLCYCLHNFALSVRFPTIVIVTDVLETGENGEGTSRVMAEIQQALESGGALKVIFNPITANSIRKVLTKISSAEKCPVSSESLSFIAESCGGDIRHAIYCLQFLSLCENPTQCTWDPGGVRYSLQKLKRRRVSEVANRKREASQSPDPIVSSCCTTEDSRPIACRDGVLSLFHALGKLLHNKRHTEAAKDSGEGINMILKGHLQRHPLNMEVPEIILSQAHSEASTFSSFLHENLLDFVDDEGIEDAAVSMSYLSDVDCLLSAKYKMPKNSSRYITPNSDEIGPVHIAEAVAGSLSARGVLFANTHPGRRRWQSIRAPVIWQVERLLSVKKAELWSKSWAANMKSLSIVARAIQATDYEPYSKLMCITSGHPSSLSSMPDNWRDVSVQHSGIHENESGIAVVLSQVPELASGMMAMDIHMKSNLDAADTTDCNDEIEEW